MLNKIDSKLVIVRGGGDIASGVIQKLHRSGFKVLVLEIENPSFIRRSVCFGEALYDGEFILEGSKAVFSPTSPNLTDLDIKNIYKILDQDNICVIIDPLGNSIEKLKPFALVDSILAKKNLGTHINMAPITIGIGPGFVAKKDVDLAIETMRGHNLGRLIFQGSPTKNTGIPGKIKGFSKERVIYSPTSGIIHNIKGIGDIVKKGDILGFIINKDIDNNKIKEPIYATIDGLLRGLIRDGFDVPKTNFKIGDIDPRIEEYENCFTISDKARTIGGAVLEGVLYLSRKL